MKNKPVSEIRIGTIKAAIWQNKAGDSIRHNVTFSRSYKDTEGNWKSTDSFGRDDLPRLILAAQKAYEGFFASNDGTAAPEEA